MVRIAVSKFELLLLLYSSFPADAAILNFLWSLLSFLRIAAGITAVAMAVVVVVAAAVVAVIVMDFLFLLFHFYWCCRLVVATAFCVK